jgi:hypothetical protein
MAITIQQAPNFGHSLHTPVWHRVLSTNNAEANFRYVFDIYVEGDFVTRLQVFPDDGYGLVDVGRVLRSYIVNYFRRYTASPTPGVFIKTNDIYIAYEVQYGEEYTAGGATTTFTNLASGTYKVYNAYPLLLSTDPYYPLLNYKYKFLTDRDTSAIQMEKAGRMLVSFLNNPATTWRGIIQVLGAGYAPGNVFITNFFGVADGELLTVDLNLEVLLGPVAAAQAVTGFTFRMQHPIGSDDSINSETIIIHFTCTPKTPATCLHFLNRHGGYESFYFFQTNRDEQEVERKTLRRAPIMLQGAVVEINPITGIAAESLIPYHTLIKSTRKLQSGYLSDKDHNWLKQLIASPIVYLEHEFTFFPVTVKTSRWSQKYTAADKLYNLEMEIEFGNQRFTQSR